MAQPIKRGDNDGLVSESARLRMVQMLREQMIRAADAESSNAAVETPALALSRALAASLRCLADLDANVRPRLALETMVVQWPMLDPSPA